MTRLSDGDGDGDDGRDGEGNGYGDGDGDGGWLVVLTGWAGHNEGLVGQIEGTGILEELAGRTSQPRGEAGWSYLRAGWSSEI